MTIEDLFEVGRILKVHVGDIYGCIARRECQTSESVSSRAVLCDLFDDLIAHIHRHNDRVLAYIRILVQISIYIFKCDLPKIEISSRNNPILDCRHEIRILFYVTKICFFVFPAAWLRNRAINQG